MKKYTFTVVIYEGCDEFWESFEGKSGTDEVTDEIKSCLNDHGFNEENSNVKLVKFEDDGK
jgi:hypothetical protein